METNADKIDKRNAGKSLLGHDVTKSDSRDNCDVIEREKWDSKIEFMLSVVGFAVDLGNVWRFPYICFKNGGGAFLVPYFIMIVIGGVPLFYLELALGQYHRKGCISIWKTVSPLFKGIGYASCLITLYVLSYYNTVIAWALYYLYSSFTSVLPWANCNHTWANSKCADAISMAAHNGSWNSTMESPAQQFFEYHVLGINNSPGIETLGSPQLKIVICLFIVYFILYFCLWKGVKSSGKAVWVTATLPYVVLFILLIRGAMLPGAGKGIAFYLKPKWVLLADPLVWLEAAAQVFFSLGPGFGTLIALSSYNNFNNNCHKDALIASTINCLTSFMAGFVVFSVMGYMAHILHKENIEDVTTPGLGLLFVVYGQALTTFDGSVFFSIIFFLMIITLGLDSAFGGFEAIITGLGDEFPRLVGQNRKLFVAVLISIVFLASLSTTTNGGTYVITLLEMYGTGAAMMVVVLCEAVAVSWFYGVERFAEDIKTMTGHKPNLYWKICWKYISPLFLMLMIIMSIIFTANLEYGSYVFPDWTTVFGWMISMSSILLIPAFALYMFSQQSGSPKQRCLAIAWVPAKRQRNAREDAPFTTGSV